MSLKERLQSDLTTAIKSRDELAAATLRMALTAITNEEVAGRQARQLTDDDVVKVLTREARKRREAAQAYDDAGRRELGDRERAEGAVLGGYLPEQLTDEELVALVRTVVEETGAQGPQAMGQVMKAVQPLLAGRAEGGRVAAEVRRQLAG